MDLTLFILTASTNTGERRTFNGNNMTHQHVIISYSGNYQAMIKRLITRKLISHVRIFAADIHPNEEYILIYENGQSNRCAVKTSTADPDVWFVNLGTTCNMTWILIIKEHSHVVAQSSRIVTENLVWCFVTQKLVPSWVTY